MQVIKKNGNQEEWNDEKIVKAILKSADHSSLEITKNQATQVAEYCKKQIQGNVVETSKLHGIVIDALRMLGYSEIANSYRNYRNFKETDYETWREMYEQAEHIIYRGDNENANFDSSLISTKGSLIKGNATKRIYQDFILNKNEKFLTRRGDIYIHDMRDMIFGSVNCFDRNTKFITTDGLKSFNDFNDGDTVTVLTAKGNWKSATVHCYGKQALNKVGIKRSRSQETYVYVTKNHRWILKDNCETTELKVGDVLCDTPKITAFEWNDLSNENKTYWCLGFLFGDGTQAHSTACSIRLCGDKSKYANRFEECGFTVTVPNNKGWNGDSMVWMHDTSKSIPPIKHMTVENIKLFINGLLCADGGKDLRSSQREFRSLQVSGEYCDDIYNMLHIAGYYVNSVTDLTEQETNYAVRRKCTKQFKIYENAVERTSWRISSIEPTNTVKDVWCLNVEDDHSFILEHGIPTGNCCLFDIANVLKNGFTMSNIKYSEPNSVLSALQVIGDITLVATAQQFGGFTLPEIDKVLLPYVKKSFNKYMDMYTHRKISKLDAEKYATEDTLKELQQGFQGLELKLNTVPCSRGDFAFTTLTFGQWDVNLAENDKYWLKEISRTILDTRRIGHNGVSVVFPKLVYLYDENQINNDHYSSELFDIAVKTSAKCMYPDYLSLSGDIEHNKVAQEYSEHGTIISPMGALAGHEHLYVKIGNNDPVDMSIKDFFDFCNGDKLKNVRSCKIFFNKDELEYKRSNTVTEATNVGHNSGVYSITYIPEDVTYIGSTSDLQRRFNEHRCKIKTIGGLDSGLNFKDRDINNYKFEVLEESENYKELEQKYIESIPNVNYKGNNTKYYKATRGNTKLYTRPNFRNKNIPQILIDLKDKDIKVLDRNNNWVKVLHVFKNDRMNTPAMMHVYYRENNKQFMISCTEDHPLWNGEKFVRTDTLKSGDTIFRADGLKLTVIDVCYDPRHCDSYDIGTASGTFIGSDIIMHNCRAYLSHWEDPNTGKAVTVGRCNIGAVSLNIPVIMAVAKQEYGSEWKSKFWALLESRLQTIREFLCKRYELISHVKASTNPLAFTQGGFYNGYRKPDEEVGNLIDYMTASFGITALNESTILWNGKTLYEDKAQFANKVIDFIDDKVQKFKKEDHHLYALYGTPAESLCGKQAKQYAELTGDTQFGEYFTNSFHCHVSEDITPVEKQNAEYVAFHKVAGGHIQYVRIDNPENFEALKAIVVRGMHKGFYQGVNFDASHCNDCGHDYLNGTNKCPKCGSTNVTTISRVCGYLGYSNINGHSRMNDAKMAEVRDRKSM